MYASNFEDDAPTLITPTTHRHRSRHLIAILAVTTVSCGAMGAAIGWTVAPAIASSHAMSQQPALPEPTRAPDPIPAPAPTDAQPSSATAIAPTPPPAPVLSERIEKLIARRAYPIALAELRRSPEDPSRSFGIDQVRRSWLAQISASAANSALPAAKVLDEIGAFRAQFPHDADAARLQTKTEARHKAAAELLREAFRTQGVEAELVLDSARHAYRIQASWKLSQGDYLAWVADPARGSLVVLVRVVSAVGVLTRHFGVRATEAQVELTGTSTKLSFPVACAERLVSDPQHTSREETLQLLRCAKIDKAK